MATQAICKESREGISFSAVDLNDVRHTFAAAAPRRGVMLHQQASDVLGNIVALMRRGGSRESSVDQAVFVAYGGRIDECRRIIRDFYSRDLPVTTNVPQPPCGGTLVVIEAHELTRRSGDVDIQRVSEQLAIVRHDGGPACPASTGIGTQGRRVRMSPIALATGQSDVFAVPLENPQHTSAHDYTASYSSRSPKFSRAMALSCGAGTAISISGTASITNSEKQHLGDVVTQTQETLDHIEALISDENFRRHGLPWPGTTLEELGLARDYIKRSIRRSNGGSSSVTSAQPPSRVPEGGPPDCFGEPHCFVQHLLSRVHDALSYHDDYYSFTIFGPYIQSIIRS
jgi:enamine deaminase RidA (YjgF/YER057c/UK114 family)